MADAFIFCSETQRRSLGKKVPADKPALIAPLWIDTDLWKGAFRNDASEIVRGPLKVLFAGKIGLRKGIPYLLQAREECSRRVSLTLVGTLEPEVESLLAKTDGVNLLPPRSKPALRELYWNHDVLVLPSLGDSFGFVALEAMACGLPVIVTENCGVPVPDPAWRVPIMNSEAIAERLLHYAADRAALEQDGRIAAEFARQYTPQRYRDQIKCLFRRLLTQ
jgi:glycosyltransferase involved in cell wall biosynthesis